MTPSKKESGASPKDREVNTSTTTTLPKLDREKSLARLTKRNGAEWVERHKGLLDDQWEYIEGPRQPTEKP